MARTREYRDLGMDRRIPRRDFLNGVAVGIAGAYAALTTEAPVEAARQRPGGADYPPGLTGLRGHYPAAVEHFASIERGAYASYPGIDVRTGETYDLVIVGGGISGLAAAYFWSRALGSSQRILVLDNHDDFGGHAKRNEFTHGGRSFIGYGGTMSISTPYPYSYVAKALVAELGIEVERNREFQNRDLFDKYNLVPGTFFDKEHFGEDRLVAGTGRLPWDQFFARAPLSEHARRDLVRLYSGKNPDYLPGSSMEEKLQTLARISYQEFLLTHARLSPDALPFFLGQGGRNNKRVDTTPALEAARRGSPGFDGLGLSLDATFREASYTFHFPDGNASIARLLVSRLIPAAIPGQHTMHSILHATVGYDRLDDRGSATRLRLRSTVVRVQHERGTSPGAVKVAYLREGRMHEVRGHSVILACYNALIPGLVPELPETQQAALRYSVKVPMMYNNVLIRRWTAYKKLGVASISAPGMYHTSSSLDSASTVAGYRAVTTPDEPIIIHMVRNPNRPGLPRKEQNRLGQEELLSTTFERFELEIRRQLARMLGSGGFDPAADIVGITVNRWPYGYTYTYDSLADPDVPPEARPHVIGRQRFGQITIANCDAGAAAFTNQSIDEAHRAVQELLVSRGLS